ncbi:EfeM/EfeO family lipoprotein [Corynebacterium vitaeruminis]|uniref:Lipoprotein involved in iron transport n=1 Tax=Corynebacterium vitaeruminis DSM 20294 TaxID=1224164 RepID=W5Y232_9CORY|nr:EfeM/EfeO family lipoprotein [Corynebacterium vitaeruminis]AHI23336.1 lipoprotein involved in iron transport [Corynebacterium vitaeruminis DSM 20294]
MHRLLPLLAAFALVLSGCASAPQEAGSESGTTDDGEVVAVRDTYSCPTPADVTGSQARWTVANTSGTVVAVYVADDQGNAYQVIERVGSSARRAWSPKLQDGSFHLVCVFRNTSSIAGGTFQVSGSSVADAPTIKPVTESEVASASVAHAAKQRQVMPRWVTLDDALLSAVRSGDRVQARQAWLAAYGAYRAFDDSNGSWPGTFLADFGSTVPGQDAPEVEGYHRVEWGLWNDEPMTEIATHAETLNAGVHEIADTLESGSFALPSADYGLRTHEVIEELERFDLQDLRDFGSHSLPTAIIADVDSEQQMLDETDPVVSARGLDTAAIRAQMDLVRATARDMDSTYGGRVAFAQWDQVDREKVSSQIAELNQELAVVATMTVIRRM